eukprot:TRINITY_DN2697_c0_g3_i2.p1 TRINITY_DN2697_c0_g3~~TRINITY_DN2697_c0_g3_i2.p1  ORF type:complete len:1086 (+),score=189.17 TRINITY_DN2697_c0_g3_i2:239-3496(+)
MFPLLVLLLSLVPLSDSSSGPHLADLNVLLPPRMTNPVEYRLQGFNGCFSWSWGHHDILSVLPEYKGTISWCSTSARLISIAPYSGQKETAVCAADLLSGTVICCNVFIDKISRIQISRHSDTVGLNGLTTLHVHAFDDKGNLFSSLVGLQFVWQLAPKSLETDGVLHHLVHIPLKDTPLSDCGSLCGDITTQIKLENSGVGSDLRVVKGAEIGHEIVSVHLLEPQLEHVADEIVLTIVEAISLDPLSPVFVIIGASIHYTLRVICQNTPQAIPFPSPYHRWSVSNTSVAQVDSTLGLAHALNLGRTNVIVEDTRVAGDTQISSMHVVLPKKMSLYIVPVTISYEPLEGARASTSTVVWNVVEGRLYVIYLKVFSDGPDMREIYITESDDAKLQCNGLLYWDTFIIPNAIAVKHGWKISCLIKTTSQGLGRVTASLAYHSGNLERPKVITVVQELMVCEKVKISTVETNDLSRPIRRSLSPRISQEAVLTAAGGCGKRLKDYNWFSSDSIVVSVSAAGLVLANKPGLAIIKAASVFDSSNFDEVIIEVSIPSSMAVLRNLPVETVVGTYLQAAVTMKASSGNYYCRCDAFSSFIRWQVLTGSEYFKIANTTEAWAFDMLPYHVGSKSLYGRPCAWASLYAANAGRALIQAALLKDLWSSNSEGHVILKASGVVGAYHPLVVRQAGDGNRYGGYWVDLTRIEVGVQNMVSTNLDELYLVPGTGLDILLLGGPEPWDHGVEFIDTVEIFTEDNELLKDGIVVDQAYTSRGTLYNCFCQKLGNFKLVFSRGNMVGDDHPLPAIADAEVSVICSLPSSITLIANEPVNRPDLILSATQADRGPGKLRISPITVANACTIRVSAVGIHSSGNAFANASSLCLKWELSHCDDLAYWEENGSLERSMSTWERFLVLQNKTGQCTVRATVAGFAAENTSGHYPENVSLQLESLDRVLTDAINLQLVSSLRIAPEFILLFFYPNAKANLSVIGGTCSLDAAVNDTEVVEVIQSPTSLQCFTLTLGIRGLGSALVTAVDIGLAVPIVASALVQVADVDWIKIVSPEEIWLVGGATQSMEILAGIHDGTTFDLSQV